MKKLLYILTFISSFECYGFQTATEDSIDKTVKNISDKGIKISDRYIIYEVKAGDTWYGIAGKFKISYPELRLANKNSDGHLFPGLKINIPTKKLKPTDPFYDKKKIDAVKYHTVTKTQTLFGIAKIYGLSVKHLKELNNLSTNIIHPGQKLIVSKEAGNIKGNKTKENNSVKSKKTISKISEEKEILDFSHEKKPEKQIYEGEEQNDISTNKILPDIDEISDEKVVFASNRQERNEKGTASFFDDDEINNDKYFAYHRTAPIGTIIRLINSSNSRKIYIKITGQLSTSSENEGLIIMISKAAAHLLGVTEKKFEVNLLYGMNKE